MNVSGKVWGQTSKIFGENNVEVHRIDAHEGGYSSMHMHAHKVSMFYVERGLLEVTIEKSYGLTDVTLLEAGQSTTIQPGEYHKFRAFKDSVCYEIYWVTLDPKDIIRRDSGGINIPK